MNGGDRLRVAALFAGIGGIEKGLSAHGHVTDFFCEADALAQAVLRNRFGDVPLWADIRNLPTLGEAELVTAGFPCQDLSQAGRTRGIDGSQSGLVRHVFDLLEDAQPRWVVLENVPFMLQLDRGRAMWRLVDELHRLGFRWAYRVIDARSFGLPQRRQRVLLLASRTEDPATVLFADEAGGPSIMDPAVRACGFYWTEGLRGLGWAVDAVPTLKGGSGVGIPSSPAIWMPDGRIGTVDIRDAERLQGFAAGWTEVDARGAYRQGHRWKLVGNAVSVRVAQWIGQRLLEPGDPIMLGRGRDLHPGDSWPRAASCVGLGNRVASVELSPWPVSAPYEHLAEFLEHPLIPLSVRAAEGFLGRAERSSLRFPAGLLDAIRLHITSMKEKPAA
ncbi:MAG: DNA (cytosine-5-)-methyltransferase [Acidimicrobiaceae bacterium]|nr:DNA (cytosine-5-)-methyltransferase [Acidimicrobiaceae bacterium]